jgi:hypothetical protein
MCIRKVANHGTTSFRVLAATAALLVVACTGDANDDTTLVIGGTPVAKATLVAGFREVVQRPGMCEEMQGLAGRDAYQALLDIISDNLGVDRVPAPRGSDVDRAGDLLVEECAKLIGGDP